jgi:hypothetical protein
MSTTRRVFPEVFKREAIDRVISSGLSIGERLGWSSGLRPVSPMAARRS